MNIYATKEETEFSYSWICNHADYHLYTMTNTNLFKERILIAHFIYRCRNKQQFKWCLNAKMELPKAKTRNQSDRAIFLWHRNCTYSTALI